MINYSMVTALLFMLAGVVTLVKANYLEAIMWFSFSEMFLYINRNGN